MYKKYTLLMIVLMVTGFPVPAMNFSEPLSYLGTTVGEVFEMSLIPDEVFPNRGAEADEDNVVFYYSRGFYLFFHGNRVWQIRFDQNYREPVFDLKMEMNRSEILSGKLEKGMAPLSTGENHLTFQISNHVYPVRMKLFFVDDRLDDLYIYRADF